MKGTDHAAAQQPLLVGPSLDEAVMEAQAIIENARQNFPHVAVVALFSGGNDSTTMLHLVRDQIDLCLHINTGIGIEQTRDFVRDIAATWRVPLVEKRTDPAWYRQQVIERGFPGPVQHSIMYHNLKRARLREMQAELRQKRGDKVLLLTGERAYESVRRSRYGEETAREADRGVWVNPLQFWTNWHMWAYREQHGIPRNPVADRVHKSGECLCGAYARRSELDEIEMWYPETAAYIHQLECEAEQAGHGQRAKWAWGSEHRRPSLAPGPMCSSCHQIEMEETA